MTARAVALALLLLAAPGCLGRDDAAVETAPAADARTRVPAAADPGPGRALLRFLRAARRGDGDAVAALLSRATRASIAPTPGALRSTVAELRDEFELVTGERVALSRRVGGRFGVAALVARTVEEGEDPEDYAYAAALVREEGDWRLELGAVAFSQLEPAGESDGEPELRARAEAGAEVEYLLVWLDGRRVPVLTTRELPFTATASGGAPRRLAPGLHTVVVFARAGDAAGAVASAFRVEE